MWGWLIMGMSALGAYSLYDDSGDTFTEKQWAGLVICLVIFVCGMVVHLIKDDM